MFTPPKKRTQGQCSNECKRRSHALGSYYGHQPDCPAIYPLQPQPGDSTSRPDAVEVLRQFINAQNAPSRDARAALAELEAKVSNYEALQRLTADHQSHALRMGQQQGRAELATELLEMAPEDRVDYLNSLVNENV